MSGPVSWLLDLLFPPKCVFCGKVLSGGERGFCARCQKELPWLTGEAAEQTGEFFSLCASPLAYRDQVRDSIRRYKFKGRQGYHKTYGRLVAQCVHDHLAGRYDLITWVPLSDKRKKERGYDQAFLLSSAAAAGAGRRGGGDPAQGPQHPGPVRPGRRRGPPANVLGAYTIVDPELVEGKRVLLIDDVITTGSTISECARVLRSAGPPTWCAPPWPGRGEKRHKICEKWRGKCR